MTTFIVIIVLIVVIPILLSSGNDKKSKIYRNLKLLTNQKIFTVKQSQELYKYATKANEEELTNILENTELLLKNPQKARELMFLASLNN